MNDHPLLPMPDRAVRDTLRDDLIDQLRSKTLAQVIAEKAAAFRDYQKEPDPYLRRRKWAMALIHTEAEIRAAIAEAIDALGTAPQPSEPDALSGEDIEYRPATLGEAWFGINYVGAAGSGRGSLNSEDIEWGDMIGDAEFSSEENAQQFADALDRAGVPNTGPMQGPDGTWNVRFVQAESD